MNVFGGRYITDYSCFFLRIQERRGGRKIERNKSEGERDRNRKGKRKRNRKNNRREKRVRHEKLDRLMEKGYFKKKIKKGIDE